MKTVKTGYAKNNLSRLIDYVKKGGRVVILDRETPVAELVPARPEPPPGSDASILASAERRGLYKRRPSEDGPIPEDIFEPGPRVKPGTVGRMLRQLRKDRDAR